jgi:hypothetical protein
MDSHDSISFCVWYSRNPFIFLSIVNHLLCMTSLCKVNKLCGKRKSEAKPLRKKLGTRRTVWLPTDLEEKVEEVRKALGLRKSAFYRFAIVELVKQYQTGRFKPKGGNQK